MEVARDVPNLSVDQVPSYTAFLQFQEMHRPHHRYFALTLEGDTVVAVAQHRHLGEGLFNTGGTGVRRAWRGRGLARACKLQALHNAREDGGHRVYTLNDETNDAMLGLNRKLGFVPLGRQRVFRTSREPLGGQPPLLPEPAD